MMKYDDIMEKINARLIPITIILVIAEFFALLLKILNVFSANIVYFLFVVTIIQFAIILMYRLTNIKNKSVLNLYEGLAGETLSFVIQFMLNQESQVNNSRVDEADLFVEVVNIPQQLDVENRKNERYDLKFIWTLKGKNDLGTDLDKISFLMGCTNSVEFSSLNFNAFHCQDKTFKNCKNNASNDCSKSNCDDYRINIDDYNCINKRKEIYLLPLEFKEAIKDNEEFIVKVIYVWPKCYNALVDYIIIDPKNFSSDLGKFNLTVKADQKIITESSYNRLHWLPRSPKEKVELTGIKTLSYIKEENTFKSGDIGAESEKIYILELRGL